MVGEIFEFLFFGDGAFVLVGFWRYLFSPRYRREKAEDWARLAAKRGGRLLVSLQILGATAVGLGTPALVLWWLSDLL